MHHETITVGIIGFGVSGRCFHYPVIASVPGLRLAAVMERRPENRHLVPPGVKIVETPDAIIDDPGISLAVICAPNEHHAALVRRCLGAGKHVVVEKPFTIESAEAYELARLARERGTMVAVYHNRRFDADFLTIRRLLASGRLGRVVRYEARFDRFRKALKGGWREQPVPGAGILYDLGPHLIDQALVLFGHPRSVTGFIRTERDGARVPDAFDVFLNYDGGPLVSLHASMLARDPAPRYVVTGTDGTYVKRGMDVQEDRLKAGALPDDDPSWGIEPEANWGKLHSEASGVPHTETIHSETGDWRLFYQDVVQSIASRVPPAVDAEDGADVVRIIELAMESSAAGRSLDFA